MKSACAVSASQKCITGMGKNACSLAESYRVSKETWSTTQAFTVIYIIYFYQLLYFLFAILFFFIQSFLVLKHEIYFEVSKRIPTFALFAFKP